MDRNLKRHGSLMQKRHCPEVYGFAAVMRQNLYAREIPSCQWLPLPVFCTILMKLPMKITHQKKIEIVAMPCPVFSTGEKMVMQRGAGICTVKSTPDKEKACITFLKWLTETRKNVEFVTSLGYMPVKQEAFDACLPEAIKELSDPMYVSLYQAFLDTQENYTFYTAPQLDSYLDLETRFEELVRKVLSVKRQQCINKPENIDKLVKETLADFKVAYTQ